MPHSINCACGQVRGEVMLLKRQHRCRCYCKDCQSFAYFLKPSPTMLDPHGGTPVIQTLATALSFSQGQEHLACLRLTPNGLLRWYTSCCQTAIGSTADNHKIAYLALAETCLQPQDAASLQEHFGDCSTLVNTASAHTDANLSNRGLWPMLHRLTPMILWAWLSGHYRQSLLFDNDGKPTVTPVVLDATQHAKLRQKLPQ